ncbi:MAG: DUF3987 domain-containing protein [Sphingomonadales bacterium]|nr:DUF3987 domain-containing protein [Sphingomonadales bacterium]
MTSEATTWNEAEHDAAAFEEMWGNYAGAPPANDAELPRNVDANDIGADRVRAAFASRQYPSAPQPEPLVPDVPEPEPYPIEALGPLRAAAEAVQRMTQAPLAIPAQSALAAASMAVQAFANVETLGGQRPLSLYCLTIAQSGERKSSCDAPLMAAMREFEREQAAAHSEARKAWAMDHAIWKARHDKTLNAIKGGKASKRELEDLGPEPTAPPLPDRLVSEPTFEGMTRLFANGQPSLGLFSDEGGQFLGGYAMSQDNKQKTLAAFNDLWMGNPIKRTRAGDGTFTLYGRRLSLHLMVQPTVAHSFLADPLAVDTGFLPRCLVCDPASTIGNRLHARARHDPAALDTFGARLGDILHTGAAMDPETRELKPRSLPLSREARVALIDYSDAIERAQAPGGQFEMIRGYASKSAEQAARMAGVLTLWTDMGAREVPAEAMGHGIALARYYLSEARRLAGVAAISEGMAKAEALRRWMHSEGWGKSWLTLREVMRQGPNRTRDNTEARKAIDLLVEHGWLTELPKNAEIEGVKVRKAWRIVR